MGSDAKSPQHGQMNHLRSSGPLGGRASDLRPCKPHPCRPRPASPGCGSARWSCRSRLMPVGEMLGPACWQVNPVGRCGRPAEHQRAYRSQPLRQVVRRPPGTNRDNYAVGKRRRGGGGSDDSGACESPGHDSISRNFSATRRPRRRNGNCWDTHSSWTLARAPSRRGKEDPSGSSE